MIDPVLECAKRSQFQNEPLQLAHRAREQFRTSSHTHTHILSNEDAFDDPIFVQTTIKTTHTHPKTKEEVHEPNSDDMRESVDIETVVVVFPRFMRGGREESRRRGTQNRFKGK